MQECYNKVKGLLVSVPVLRFFDTKETTVLSVDASSYGLGAVLLQNERPVSYASATLSESQRRYAQIEKELLAVVFALEHFHYYVYGRQVVVQTDHKPLIGLSTKQYDTIFPRLQRLLLRLQHYDVHLTYVPGKQLLVADAPSRAPLITEKVDTAEIETSAASVCLVVQASPCKLQQIKEATAMDTALQRVLQYIKDGWPERSSDMSPETRGFWHCKEELHFTDGLLCRGNRLVLPAACIADALKKLHLGHRGIVTCKNKARETLYWPTMNADIEALVKKLHHMPGASES